MDYQVNPEFAAELNRFQESTVNISTCFNCGTSGDDRPLLPVRTQGTSTWVCTRCLPSLIHG